MLQNRSSLTLFTICVYEYLIKIYAKFYLTRYKIQDTNLYFETIQTLAKWLFSLTKYQTKYHITSITV